MKLEQLLEFGGPRGNLKQNRGKETSVIRKALKNAGIEPQRIGGGTVARTAYSDKTKMGYRFKIYLNNMPSQKQQEAIEKEIKSSLPEAKVSFGPGRRSNNFDRSPFIRVNIEEADDEQVNEGLRKGVGTQAIRNVIKKLNIKQVGYKVFSDKTKSGRRVKIEVSSEQLKQVAESKVKQMVKEEFETLGLEVDNVNIYHRNPKRREYSYIAVTFKGEEE